MSVVNSIRSVLVPIHPEGKRFVAGFAIVTVALAFVWQPLFWLGLALTIWCAMFFRDPARIVPQGPDIIVSPADGRVSAIGSFVPPAELGMGAAPMMRISVFMNVFDVHINRAPVAGPVTVSSHKAGKFLAADLDKASEENERHCITIDGPNGPVGTVQIAGLVARRILNWSNAGDRLEQGERFGLIRFGSRCDVFVPEGAVPRVAVGQKAIAGETILAAHEGAFDEASSVRSI